MNNPAWILLAGSTATPSSSSRATFRCAHQHSCVNRSSGVLVGKIRHSIARRRAKAILPCFGNVMPRRSYVSSARETYFTQRKHQKQCPRCGKANLLWLPRCSFCNRDITCDSLIRDAGRCDLVEAVLTERYRGRPVLEKTWDVISVESRFPAARAHLMIFPKTRIEDLLKCERRHLPLLRQLYERGVHHLRDVYNIERQFLCGFSYPSEYQQLCLHVLAPPIRNFLLFRKSTWYFYRDVCGELAQTGEIRRHPESLEIDPTVVKLDKIVRETRRLDGSRIVEQEKDSARKMENRAVSGEGGGKQVNYVGA
ncbi:unnamed protein product [Amoebophrya sp. A25]|nr:unnamed protein product [Amoebophrya sp. A25]|eukprot:GSA25T00005770001.1